MSVSKRERTSIVKAVLFLALQLIFYFYIVHAKHELPFGPFVHGCAFRVAEPFENPPRGLAMDSKELPSLLRFQPRLQEGPEAGPEAFPPGGTWPLPVRHTPASSLGEIFAVGNSVYNGTECVKHSVCGNPEHGDRVWTHAKNSSTPILEQEHCVRARKQLPLSSKWCQALYAGPLYTVHRM